MDNRFSPNGFFDISKRLFTDFFKSYAFVWEAIPALPAYISSVLKAEILGEIEEGAWVEPGMVRLEEGSRIERGAVVKGPTIIGRNTVVRSHAYIRGSVMTGEDCLIGTGVEIRQTLMLDGSSVLHDNCIFTSLIGNGVGIDAHSSTANMRLDKKEIRLKIERNGETRVIPTGLDKFGAIIGDNTQISTLVVMMPGTLFGRGCIVYPHSQVGGYFPDGSVLGQAELLFEAVRKGEGIIGRKVP